MILLTKAYFIKIILTYLLIISLLFAIQISYQSRFLQNNQHITLTFGSIGLKYIHNEPSSHQKSLNLRHMSLPIYIYIVKESKKSIKNLNIYEQDCKQKAIF